MKTYLCDCGRERPRGERLCKDCRAEEKKARQEGRQLAKEYTEYVACPPGLRDWIQAQAELAFVKYAVWEWVKRGDKKVLILTAAKSYGSEKQIQEGLPAVSTPFFWFEGIGPGGDPVAALINATERLGRFDPQSVKVPAVAIGDPRLEEPAVILPGRPFWRISNEWTE